MLRVKIVFVDEGTLCLSPFCVVKMFFLKIIANSLVRAQTGHASFAYALSASDRERGKYFRPYGRAAVAT